MEKQINPIHSKLRLAGVLIMIGLAVQAISLLWNHPLSFIAFVAIGGLFLGIGIILYLLTLVNIPTIPPEKESDKIQKPRL
ncbi:MAG TPA: hypothetical protein VJW20_12760 [Candidatus Angelobacter sp.]|nr:hypothetical protein [Candidatus Angelobacter sp.]